MRGTKAKAIRRREAEMREKDEPAQQLHVKRGGPTPAWSRLNVSFRNKKGWWKK